MVSYKLLLKQSLFIQVEFYYRNQWITIDRKINNLLTNCRLVCLFVCLLRVQVLFCLYFGFFFVDISVRIHLWLGSDKATTCLKIRRVASRNGITPWPDAKAKGGRGQQASRGHRPRWPSRLKNRVRRLSAERISDILTEVFRDFPQL